MESAENQAQPGSINEAVDNSSTLSKTETIALLNNSIDRLEETIKKISENSTTMPSTNSINDLLSTTQALENSVAVQPTTQTALQSDRTPKAAPMPQQVVSKTETATEPKLDSKTVARAKKKNTGLIVIAVMAIAVATVTVFWLWQPEFITNLFSQEKSIPSEVAIFDPELKQPPTTIDSVDDSRGIADSSNARNSERDFPAVVEPVAEPIEDVVETVIPDELTAPGREKELRITAIKPQLNFTPEQNLIAALKTKVQELTQSYPSQYIAKVEVNLPNNSLLVRVTDDWYNLEEPRQNSLGNEILQRSREYSFSKLQLQDSQGTLVARSPVIGNNIILVDP